MPTFLSVLKNWLGWRLRAAQPVATTMARYCGWGWFRRCGSEDRESDS